MRLPVLITGLELRWRARCCHSCDVLLGFLKLPCSRIKINGSAHPPSCLWAYLEAPSKHSYGTVLPLPILFTKWTCCRTWIHSSPFLDLSRVSILSLILCFRNTQRLHSVIRQRLLLCCWGNGRVNQPKLVCRQEGQFLFTLLGMTYHSSRKKFLNRIYQLFYEVLTLT